MTAVRTLRDESSMSRIPRPMRSGWLEAGLQRSNSTSFNSWQKRLDRLAGAKLSRPDQSYRPGLRFRLDLTGLAGDLRLKDHGKVLTGLCYSDISCACHNRRAEYRPKYFPGEILPRRFASNASRTLVC